MDPRRAERIVREVSADVERVAGGRFSVKTFIGAGSYGEVCGGIDTLTGRRVAIKRVATCLQHGTRKAILKDVFLAKRVLREVAMLTHFSHPNILSLHAVCIPPPTGPLPPGSPPPTPHPAAFRASPPEVPPGHPLHPDVQSAALQGVPVQQTAGAGGFACGAGDLLRAERMFLVMDLMDTDLQSIIRSGQPLSVDHVSYFTFQVLLALKALHDARVMHRDLHPANVLLSLEHDVKLCDFNLCREEAPVAASPGGAAAGGGGDAAMTPAGLEGGPAAAGGAAGEGDGGEVQPTADLTDYVTSRWYRAPELVMQWRQYNRAVDLWSLGCLMAEMFRGCPLFRGSTFYQQLDTIVRVIGRPPEEEVAHIGTPAARRYLYRNADFAGIVPKDLRTVVPNASETAIDLLEKLLVFHPDKRMTVDEALRHPFYADLYHPDDLPLPHPVFEKDADIEALKTPEEIAAALEQYVLALAGDDYRRNHTLVPPASR